MLNLKKCLLFKLIFIGLLWNFNTVLAHPFSLGLNPEPESFFEYPEPNSSSLLLDDPFVIDDINCELNYYNITIGQYAEFNVIVSYSRGIAASYPEGELLSLGNGTLTARLQAGTINPEGGNLVYRVQGTPDNANPAIIPINFGGKTCEVPIYISEPSQSSIDFWVLSYNDINKDCVKDRDEEPANTDGLFIKVFDLDNNMLFSAPAFMGQFEVLGFNGLSDYIYYYIIDNNEDGTDSIPTLNPGWKSGTEPYLKRYFYFYGGMTYFNTSPESNLLDASWDLFYPFAYRICLYQIVGKIDALNCEQVKYLYPIVKGESISNLLTIKYEGGNGGFYTEQVLQSIGVSGLTATLNSGFFNEGNGSITLTISGTANVGGKGYFDLSIGGQTCQIEFIVEDPKLNITNELKQSTFKSVGDKLDYTISVCNIGNVDLIDVFISNPLTGLSEKLSLLKVGEKKEINTSYAVNQTDIDAGLLINTAKASVNYRSIELEVFANKTVNATQLPAINLIKKSPQTFYSSIGDVLDYVITVSNTGNVTLLDVIVRDPLTGLSEIIKVLSPKEIKTFNTKYNVKQSDLDAGKLSNVVYAEFIWNAVPTRGEASLVLIADSDGDGVPDLVEKEKGTNPKDPCSFKLASQTLKPNSAWNNSDCDGDGVSNLMELSDLTNPLEPCDFNLANRTLTPSISWNLGDCDKDGLKNGEDGSDDCDKDGIPNFLDDDTCKIDIIIPNVFTPNGDGINDIIKPILLGINKLICFKIYNQMGNLVFETKEKDHGWNGSFRSSDQGTESYLWFIEAFDRDGKIVKRTGIITLINKY
ncbi:gliding motility-associated C-terminal domain-containing protein [Daejeonella sp.]|uniref:DUF7507 domain-containing protein n=1 Tax=Daejeonella sp. TaxID=2805397 RepID=UPI0025C6BA7C|nr:gliding motility-associated C-terminal domain-containing protein [Daejeonella sp.]